MATLDVPRLRQLCSDRELSLRELARQAGVPAGTLLALASRGGRLDADTLLRLAETLSVEPRELLPRHGPEKNPTKS